MAAANGYIEVAEFLLDNHVSVDTRDSEGWQPIHAAAYWAQVCSVTVLSVFGPTVWNSLPLSLRKTQFLSAFKKKLKTHLFEKHLS